MDDGKVFEIEIKERLVKIEVLLQTNIDVMNDKASKEELESLRKEIRTEIESLKKDVQRINNIHALISKAVITALVGGLLSLILITK